MPDPTPFSLDQIYNDSIAQAQSESTPPVQEPPQQQVQQPTTPQPTEQTPPPEPPSRATLEAMAKRGYNVSNFASDDDYFREIEQAEVQRQAIGSQLEEFNRDRDDFYRWKASQQAPPQTPPETPQEPEQPKWGPPAPSAMALEMAQRGYIPVDPQTGRFKAVDSSFAKFEQELNAARDWQQEKVRLMLNSPDQWFEETGLVNHILSKIPTPQQQSDEELFQKFEQWTNQQSQKQQLQSELDQAIPFLYQMENGQLKINQAGDPIPTELGLKYETTYNQLHQMNPGMDPDALQKNSLFFLKAEMQAAMNPATPPANPPGQTPPPAQPAQSPREQQQETWLSQNTGSNGHNRLPPESTQILEAAQRSNPGNSSGFTRIGDVFDQAYNETLREGQ